jgi:hypothetical protein
VFVLSPESGYFPVFSLLDFGFRHDGAIGRFGLRIRKHQMIWPNERAAGNGGIAEYRRHWAQAVDAVAEAYSLPPERASELKSLFLRYAGYEFTTKLSQRLRFKVE